MRRWPWDFIIFLGVGLLVILGAHAWSGNHSSPRGIQNVTQYWKRFGEPSLILQLEKDGKVFFWVRGKMSAIHQMTLPSDAPGYIFNSDGQFVEWCYDPGDTPSFNRKWGRKYQPNEIVKMEEFRERFALPAK